MKCAFCETAVDESESVELDGTVYCSPKHAANDRHATGQRATAGGGVAADAAAATTEPATPDGDVAADTATEPDGELDDAVDDEDGEWPEAPPQKPTPDVQTDAQSAQTVADDDADPEHAAVVAGHHVPEAMKEMEIWAVWSPVFGKVPMAPWETGNMYPAAWGADTPTDERPETEYEQARMVAEMDPTLVHDSYPFPPLDDGDSPHIPATLYPTVFLPHDPADPPLMQVDFDDVRDPKTGEISAEVAEILDRLDGYTEVSQSGEGLHVFVRAKLPGALGKFIGSLDTEGEIELYDHGRFVGCTWEHVDGTPTTVPERQDVIGELIEKYETESQRKRRQRSTGDGKGSSIAAKKASDELDAIRDDFDVPDGGSGGSNPGVASGKPTSSGGKRSNPYYRIDPEAVARRGRFGGAYFQHREEQREWQNGPHPGHGPQHSEVEECTNFGIKNGGWSCFAHEGGAGGGLSLLAVVEGIVDCDSADRVHDSPRKLLKTCLAAREHVTGLDDAEPPYTALVGVAKELDLPMKDPDDGVLGKDTHRMTLKIFGEMEPSDVTV